MSKVHYRYNSLEDFLASEMLTVDGVVGFGDRKISVKGREIDATILFCDISDFSGRTRNLSPTETLIFINHFFTWMTALTIAQSRGVIDKYIGDEVMIVFSREFGSDDPFEEAIRVACGVYERDSLAFAPHVGIASGRVIVGHVGTAIRYNCSVFGTPVALAARCASVRQNGGPENRPFSGAVTFPAVEWGERDLNKVVPPTKIRNQDGSVTERPAPLELKPPRLVKMKNLPDTEIREIVNRVYHLSEVTPQDWARMAGEQLRQAGRYWR